VQEQRTANRLTNDVPQRFQSRKFVPAGLKVWVARGMESTVQTILEIDLETWCIPLSILFGAIVCVLILFLSI
jgi:hypothetical protein